MCSVFGLLMTNCVVDAGTDMTEADLGTEQSALTISTNQTGTNNGYYYTFWKDGGSVSMNLNSGGNYSVSWGSGTYNFVGGKGWNPGSSTRVVGYNAGVWSPGSSNAYLCLYGWTKNTQQQPPNRVVEYYIVDSWGSWRPPGGTKAGSVTTDGGTYDLYRTFRANAPSIDGNQDFYQFWSVRTSKRSTGVNSNITFANHKNAWASKGWNLGTHNYQVMATEVFNPASSGSSNISVW
jgi:endo-1,4-beta-xylanase